MKKAPTTLQAAGALGEQLSFIDPLTFSPAFPTRGTLADRLLLRLLAGESFTHPEWQDITGSWRLAATAGDLRELDWPVESLTIHAPTVANPVRTIARYRMQPGAIAAGRLLREARQ
jgi:hypothetical protein